MKELIELLGSEERVFFIERIFKKYINSIMKDSLNQLDLVILVSGHDGLTQKEKCLICMKLGVFIGRVTLDEGTHLRLKGGER